MSGSAPARQRGRRGGDSLAALLLAVATAAALYPVLEAGPVRSVAIQEYVGAYRVTSKADATFQSWLVARNARTLATRPQRLFDTGHCAPAEKTLTLGIPMVTQGLLAIPAFLATNEPVLIYNVSIALLTWLTALAMYLLVSRWTGSRAAGCVAGLLFGLSPLRLGHILHPSVWDISWTVFAIFFAERLLAKGGWRDALGLGAAIALPPRSCWAPILVRRPIPAGSGARASTTSSGPPW